MTPGKLIRDKKSDKTSHDSKKERPKSDQDPSSQRLQQSSAERLCLRPATSGRQVGLVRSERALFQDEELLASGVVVVDVHNENKEMDVNSAARISENEALDEIKMKRSGKTKSGRLFEHKSTVDDDKSSSRSFKGDRERSHGREEIREDTVQEIEDAAGSVEELEELSRDLNNSNSTESFSRSFKSDENFVSKSGKNLMMGEESDRTTDQKFVVSEPRRRRKRWSKDKRNLYLTDELIANSSDINRTSAESSSRSSPGFRVKPVPAPRKKKYSKSLAPESSLAYDNAAFRSDPEEVLRIETEIYDPQETSDGKQKYRRSTKIEMTNVYNSRKRELFHSEEDECPGTWNGKTDDKMEKFSASRISNSNEFEREIREVNKSEDFQTLSTPMKNRRESENSPIVEVSEFSENDAERLESDACEMTAKNKFDSVSLNTGNSLTDISDLPRSKSCGEHSQTSCTRKSRNSKKNEISEKIDSSSQKRKSKRRNKSSVQNSVDHLIEYTANKIERFTSITIHKADMLETDFITRHPMVKVHIVEMNTGLYLKGVRIDDDVKCSYLQPMITGKFDFKENRSIVPNWEEELVFEYSFDEVIRVVNKPILILFELLDLLNFAEASFNYNTLGSEGCWHKIAWAFLRPVGVSGAIHADKKVRLQLYQPPKVPRKSGRLRSCEVFNWWRSVHRDKYPSTLYVTLKAIEPPTEDPILYEWLSLNELPEIEDESCDTLKKSSEVLQLPKWSRLAAQSCKIPNHHLFESDIFENGCFYVAFSNNGKYLACVGSEEDNYPILVYSIPEGEVCVRFIGHQNFIYSLNWSTDDKYLLSVSSDQTARIWDMHNRIVQQIQMLPHPSYVYCGKFYPGRKHVVVTGCYDHVVRVWTKSKRSKRYELTQELDEHQGFVSSLCFQKDGGLITADSVGTVTLWTLERKAHASAGREWRFLKTIKNSETENIVVNTIVLHPLGSRLLLHSRDSCLRMIDLETGFILQRYKGLRNRRLQTTACISPCGGLILCGGEDSYLTVWNLENGEQAARYLIKDAKVVACVAYHPFDHILAFSTFGSASAVQILNFEKSSTGENVGLSLLSGNEDFDVDQNMDIMMRFDQVDRGLSDLPNSNSRLNKGKWSRSLDGKYSDKKPDNLVRREEMVGENSRSRRELLKLKIQRLNDSEEGRKSKSAARLNSIIDKIDKILLNTTLKRGFDSTSSSADARMKNVAKVSSKSEREYPSKNTEERISRSRRNRSGDKSSTPSTDEMTELHSGSGEFIELRKLNSARNELTENEKTVSGLRRIRHFRANSHANASSTNDEDESDGNRFRSKSRSSEPSRRTSEENKFHRNSTAEMNVGKERRRSRSSNKLVSGSEDCVIELECIKDSSPSTPESFETYTIDKDAFSTKYFAPDKSKPTETSSSSAKSSATFTIENEMIPVTRESAIIRAPWRTKR